MDRTRQVKLAEATLQIVDRDAERVVEDLIADAEESGHCRSRRSIALVFQRMVDVSRNSELPKKARKGINPFTGQETIFKAKPATVKVKDRPMQKLTDAASALPATSGSRTPRGGVS